METTSPTSTQHTAVKPMRARDFAFAMAIVVHGALGLLWAGMILLIRDLRDCFMTECDGVTGAEWAADLTAWTIGGVSWAALTYLFVKSMHKRSIYWAFLVSPGWFVVATCSPAA
jgi:hypothetical protein